MPPRKMSHATRFWLKVEKSQPEMCWLWKGGKRPNGYGRISVKNVGVNTHRFSWELHNGPIPYGMVVRHSCDTKLCVNPSHLSIGTQKDNLSDMVSRGRSLQGVRNHASKLTELDVRFIRHWLKGPYFLRDIGRAFGVSTMPIMGIKHRRQWTHVS
jgi:hypothetical protein